GIRRGLRQLSRRYLFPAHQIGEPERVIGRVLSDVHGDLQGLGVAIGPAIVPHPGKTVAAHELTQSGRSGQGLGTTGQRPASGAASVAAAETYLMSESMKDDVPMTSPLSFETRMDFAYGEPREIAPGIQRLVANNPGPFTFKGTNSYLIGTDELGL